MAWEELCGLVLLGRWFCRLCGLDLAEKRGAGEENVPELELMAARLGYPPLPDFRPRRDETGAGNQEPPFSLRG